MNIHDCGGASCIVGPCRTRDDVVVCGYNQGLTFTANQGRK